MLRASRAGQGRAGQPGSSNENVQMIMTVRHAPCSACSRVRESKCAVLSGIANIRLGPCTKKGVSKTGSLPILGLWPGSKETFHFSCARWNASGRRHTLRIAKYRPYLHSWTHVATSRLAAHWPPSHTVEPSCMLHAWSTAGRLQRYIPAHGAAHAKGPPCKAFHETVQGEEFNQLLPDFAWHRLFVLHRDLLLGLRPLRRAHCGKCTHSEVHVGYVQVVRM